MKFDRWRTVYTLADHKIFGAGPRASHDFLQPDGRTLSICPDFHPLISRTAIAMGE